MSSIDIKSIEASMMDRARYVTETGSLAVATDITKAVSLIDVSRTARAAGDLGTAEHSLDRARALLLALIGIFPENGQ